MAPARPLADRSPDVDAFWLALGRILLAAARDHPPPWPAPDATEDLDEPALVRKQRRHRRSRPEVG